MFHIGRSGSKVLADMLEQHPAIATWWKERLPAPSLLGAEGLHGFDLKFYQVRRMGYTVERFIAHLQEKGCQKFVILRRKNYLRKVVSSLLGLTHGFHASSPVQRLHTIRLDPDRVGIDMTKASLLDFFFSWDRDFETLDKLLPQALHLEFDGDLLPDPQEAYRKTLGFLALEGYDPLVRFSRTTPWPLTEILENYEEIRTFLSRTPYAWMLEDEHPQE